MDYDRFKTDEGQTQLSSNIVGRLSNLLYLSRYVKLLFISNVITAYPDIFPSSCPIGILHQSE